MAAFDCSRESCNIKAPTKGLSNDDQWDDTGNLYITYAQKPTAGKFNLCSKFSEHYAWVQQQYIKDNGGVLFVPHAMDQLPIIEKSIQTRIETKQQLYFDIQQGVGCTDNPEVVHSNSKVLRAFKEKIS